jgi:ABC-type transporter Mla subunit MlaD
VPDDARDRLAKVSADLREFEAQASLVSESARESVARTRERLEALDQALNKLKMLATAFDMLAERLTLLTAKASTEIATQGTAAQPFIQLVDQLINAARTCAMAVRHLEVQVRASASTAESIADITEKSQAVLERFAPALRTLADAAARSANARSGATIVVVDGGTSSNSNNTSGSDAVRGEADIWTALLRPAAGLKN